ncbi:MAG: hypothetical protein ACLT07_06005 [Clostridia bacterium]
MYRKKYKKFSFKNQPEIGQVFLLPAKILQRVVLEEQRKLSAAGGGYMMRMKFNGNR